MTEMEFEAFFDRSQQKTTVRDKMVDNEMRGCYGRRNKDACNYKLTFEKRKEDGGCCFSCCTGR